MRLICLAGPLLLRLVVGCGTSVNWTPLNTPPRALAPREVETVEVYSSAPPTRSHTDVGLLEVVQDTGINEQGTSLMIQRLREKAAEHGCDAVHIGGASERDGEPSDSVLHLLDPGSRTLQATCIVFADAELVPAAPNSTLQASSARIRLLDPPAGAR